MEGLDRDEVELDVRAASMPSRDRNRSQSRPRGSRSALYAGDSGEAGAVEDVHLFAAPPFAVCQSQREVLAVAGEESTMTTTRLTPSALYHSAWSPQQQQSQELLAAVHGESSRGESWANEEADKKPRHHNLMAMMEPRVHTAMSCMTASGSASMHDTTQPHWSAAYHDTINFELPAKSESQPLLPVDGTAYGYGAIDIDDESKPRYRDLPFAIAYWICATIMVLLWVVYATLSMVCL